MANCRSPGNTVALASSAAGRCPRSGTVGTAVDRQTVKALLTERALARLTRDTYRFCPDGDCEIVYFSEEGVRFAVGDVRVGIWQKQSVGDRQVCYCFGESEGTIRAEIAASGRSSVIERIRAHVAAGRCACEVRNPRGTCCLGDVAAAVARVRATLDAAPD